jgi:uncharacterized phage protein gp47/JayE
VSGLPVTWPIPAPATIASQAAGVYEGLFPGIDARSANSVAAANCRIVSLTGYDLYQMQVSLANELMVNTAVAWLPFHANIWQVPQLQPTPATGNAVFANASGAAVVVPAGTLLSFATGWLYMTTAAVTIPAASTGSAPITSALAGTTYNLPAGTVLALVSPIGGITPSSATLDSNGAADGTDLETTDAWRARIVAEIGNPGDGGSLNDYVVWAKKAGAAFVNVVPQAVGPGSVGIYIAGPGPSVASAQLVAAVQAYITGPSVKPTTARVLVMASTLMPENVTLHLNPDTALTRAAAVTGLELFFLQSALQQNQTGQNVLYMSRLDSAISSASGEYSHERYAPAADLTFPPSQLFTLGAVYFE